MVGLGGVMAEMLEFGSRSYIPVPSDRTSMGAGLLEGSLVMPP